MVSHGDELGDLQLIADPRSPGALERFLDGVGQRFSLAQRVILLSHGCFAPCRFMTTAAIGE
jgi:hypothetical protein